MIRRVQIVMVHYSPTVGRNRVRFVNVKRRPGGVLEAEQIVPKVVVLVF